MFNDDSINDYTSFDNNDEDKSTSFCDRRASS